MSSSRSHHEYNNNSKKSSVAGGVKLFGVQVSSSGDCYGMPNQVTTVAPVMVFPLHINHSTTNLDDHSRSLLNRTPLFRFKCEFCKQRFGSSQALGGHQNAHKNERKLARLRAEYRATHHRHPQYIYGQLTAMPSDLPHHQPLPSSGLATTAREALGCPATAAVSTGSNNEQLVPVDDDGDLDLELRLGIRPSNFTSV